MTLQEIFDQLTFGELGQFVMGGQVGTRIPEARERQVYALVNLGLQEMYKRFWLRSGEVLIQMYDHISEYRLHSRYAASNTLSPEPYKYLMDSVYTPFQDDVLKIEQVFNQCGEQVCLNDLTEPCSVFTPRYDVIQVPVPDKYSVFSVQYRATHPMLKWAPDIEPGAVEVDLPHGLLEPLVLYIGSRVLMNHGPSSTEEAALMKRDFERSCKEAKRANIGITSNLANVRLDTNHWV